MSNNREQNAMLYDQLLTEGDAVNRKISTIKSNFNRTPAQETELIQLNKQLGVLEGRLNHLLSQL